MKLYCALCDETFKPGRCNVNLEREEVCPECDGALEEYEPVDVYSTALETLLGQPTFTPSLPVDVPYEPRVDLFKRQAG